MGFPSSPIDEDIYTNANGTRYQYDATDNKWVVIGGAYSVNTLTVATLQVTDSMTGVRGNFTTDITGVRGDFTYLTGTSGNIGNLESESIDKLLAIGGENAQWRSLAFSHAFPSISFSQGVHNASGAAGDTIANWEFPISINQHIDDRPLHFSGLRLRLLTADSNNYVGGVTITAWPTTGGSKNTLFSTSTPLTSAGLYDYPCTGNDCSGLSDFNVQVSVTWDTNNALAMLNIDILYYYD